jgi:hypothetical protein
MVNSVIFEKVATHRFGASQIQKELYLRAPQVRTVVRFLGPSKFSTPEYEAKVYSILEHIKIGLAPVREKVGISTGVSDIGLDAMLARCFTGKYSTSGVVSWMIGKISLELSDGTTMVLEDKDYNTKAKKVAEIFGIANGLPGMFIEGQMPGEGIEIDNPGLWIGRLDVKKLRFEQDSTPFSRLDRFSIFGPDWGQVYEMFRPSLSAVVVLGGEPISEQEAITAHTLCKSVFCIDPGILGEPHLPADPAKNKPEVPSASVQLIKNRGFRPYDVEDIIRGITRLAEASSS